MAGPAQADSTGATWTDGRTARRRPVTARIGADGLHLIEENGTVAAIWPFAELELVDEAYAGRPFRLRRRSGAGRLTVADPGFLDRLQPHAPRLRRRDRRRRTLPWRVAGWIGATAAILAAFWFLLPLAAGPVASLAPRSWEEALGRFARQQALALFAPDARTCTGREGRRAMDRLVARLAAARPSRYRFRVAVVDSGTENAFAAPGGHIVVFRGLIDTLPDADALAGVLAHEMGHVIERHGTEQIIKVLGLSVVAGALIGDTSAIGSAASEMARILAGAKFSRDAEREADRIAVDMLNRTNISGRGFQAFFQRMAGQAEEHEGSAAQYFATHPATAGRARFVGTHATGTGAALTAGEWRAIAAMCRE